MDKEKKRLYDLNYYRKNREILRRKSSQWQKEHPETVKNRMKAYKDSGRFKEVQQKRVDEIREFIDFYKAEHGCIICGEKDPAVLDFHHIDPTQKVNNVAYLKYRSLSKVVEELSKCVVVCANDHRRIERGAIKLPKEIT
jgi:hypothetical protein